jgi:hypothetical protein
MIFFAVAVEPVNASLSGPALRRAGRPGAGDQPEHRLLRDHRGEAVDQPPADRGGVFRRLEHDRVPGRQRIHDRAERREDGVVPRADHADHPVRLVFQGRGQVGDQQPGPDPARAEHPLGVARRPVQVLDRGRQLDHRVVDRLAALPVDQLGELGGPGGEGGPPGAEPLGAAGEPEPGPPLGRRAGPRDGGPYVRLGVHREGADRLPGRRVERLERLAVHHRHTGHATGR